MRRIKLGIPTECVMCAVESLLPASFKMHKGLKPTDIETSCMYNHIQRFMYRVFNILLLPIVSMYRVSMRKNVFCTSCKHFILPDGESNTKYGQCKKFLRNTVEKDKANRTEDSLFDIETEDDASYYFYVNGVRDTSPYYYACICRALHHMCGKHGDLYEPIT
jgi:hypothetical protein